MTVELLDFPGACNHDVETDQPDRQDASEISLALGKSDIPNSVASLSVYIEKLQREVDRIALRHRSELDTCIESWTRRHSILIHGQSNSMSQTFIPTNTNKRSTNHSANDEIVAVTKSDDPHASEFDHIVCDHSDVEKKESQLTHSKTLTNQSSEKANRKKKLFDKNISQILVKSVRDEVASQRTFLQRFTQNHTYELISVFVILANSALIGYETQYLAERKINQASNGEPIEHHMPWGFTISGILFTMAFAVDVGLRWAADGYRFFYSHDSHWNFMDLTVVIIGFIDSLLEVALDADAKTEIIAPVSVIRVLRVVRLVRIAKVIRVMHFFRELRVMVFSILGSLKPLLWVLLILFLEFYVFGICFTAACTAIIDLGTLERHSDLLKYFGTLDKSMLSLYMSMSGGNDWGLYYDVLEDLSFIYKLLFLVFITFSCVAIVNIVTGVFVDAAMQANQTDREIVVHEELENKKAYLSSMNEIFEEMDGDGTGFLTMEEFEDRLRDERVIAYFQHLKLDVSDAHVLFELLDTDHTGTITVDEFLLGCYKLQGESSHMDFKLMQCEVKHIKRIVRDCFYVMNAVEGELSNVRDVLRNGSNVHETCDVTCVD